MYLEVKNSNLVYRQYNRDVPIPISSMTKKIYNYNAKTVKITATVRNAPRVFIFFLSEIKRPLFVNFDAMVLWFDENVILPTGGSLTSSIGNIRRSETFYAPSYISYLGFAPDGSLETDAVWTITKRVGSADGTIVSNIQSSNKKWSERSLL